MDKLYNCVTPCFNSMFDIDIQMLSTEQKYSHRKFDSIIESLTMPNKFSSMKELNDALMNLIKIVGPNKILDEKYRDNLNIRMLYFKNRISWAVPNQDFIKTCQEFVDDDSILSIGSGRSFIEKLFLLKKIKVHPTDNYKWQMNGHFCKVEKINHKNAIKKYSDANVLMLIWPPHSDPMASESLKLFKGNKVIYVGEGIGGCTANNKFFDLLNKEWNVEKCFEMSRFKPCSVYDSCLFYTRKIK